MKRILLKLSGESLKSPQASPFDFLILSRLATHISELCQQGIQVAIVIGGGNLFRGAQQDEIERVTADHIGMLATMMNGLALQEVLKKMGITCHVMAPYAYIPCMKTYSVTQARHHLEENHVVICVGGTGSPYFTTDTASVLRALELNCDALLKATNVLGVYDKDPKHHKDAVLLPRLTFDEVIEKRYQVMDLTAFTLARDAHLPIIVFSVQESFLSVMRQQVTSSTIS